MWFTALFQYQRRNINIRWMATDDIWLKTKPISSFASFFSRAKWNFNVCKTDSEDIQCIPLNNNIQWGDTESAKKASVVRIQIWLTNIKWNLLTMRKCSRMNIALFKHTHDHSAIVYDSWNISSMIRCSGKEEEGEEENETWVIFCSSWRALVHRKYPYIIAYSPFKFIYETSI